MAHRAVRFPDQPRIGPSNGFPVARACRAPAQGQANERGDNHDEHRQAERAARALCRAHRRDTARPRYARMRGFDVLHLEQLWSGWLGLAHRRKALVNIHCLPSVDLAGAPRRGLEVSRSNNSL